MKKSFYYRIVVAFAAVLTIIGCEDYLEREPLGRYTTENYPEGGLTQYVYGMYSDLRGFSLHAFPFIGITSITSDDADKGSTPADAPDQRAFDEFNILPSNPLVLGFYRDSYSAISKANVVFQQSDTLKASLSDEEYFTARAEASFIRAYLYFNLVRSFGGVPKVTTVITEEDEFNIPRASQEEIYALIEEDLLFAAQYLPLSWEDYPGRVTQGAANGLLAKVYLYQKRWADALGAAQAVINSGQYDLSTPYDQIFTEAGENSSESIFEVQNLHNQTYQFGSEYATVQGARGSGSWDLGWGFNSPSEALLNAYEEGDPRMDATILFRGEITPYGEIPPETLPNERYNQKVYTNPSFRAAANSQAGQWVNIRLLRYADVVLIAAEAANELGQTEVALEMLEMVRARARGGNDAVLPRITTTNQAELRELIRHERRIELAMEHERFFDIVRWGIAEEVLHAAGKTGFVAGKHELMPIPQDEIDRSNGVLNQNPGY